MVERIAGRVEVGAELRGVPAAPGVAVGPVWRHRAASGAAARAPLSAGPAELEAAADAAAAQLAAIAEHVRGLGRDEEAAIFDAQAAMALDPTLLDAAKDRLGRGEPPVDAIRAAADSLAEQLAAVDDELLAARAADVRDVGQRIIRVLTGETLELPDRPSIAVADDLPPSVTAEIPEGLLLGICLQAGSRTSHAAILSRALGIPAVVAVAGLLDAVDGAGREGEAGASVGPGGEGPGAELELALDGVTGEVVLRPDDAVRAAFAERAERRRRRAEAMVGLRGRPGALADGTRVALIANIGGPDDAPRAIAAGAEGVGLFRTEFLFMRRPTPPTEAEQADAYRRVLEAFGPGRPVVVRLADIGGDKAIPYLDLPHEDNPFLGVRAIRLAYRSRDLLVTQLRAIAVAGAAAGVAPHLMAPMVAAPDDVALLPSLVDEALRGLDAAGRARAPRLVVGIMVEIPSAAVLAPELARSVDFMSIGTNDLTQYTLAADRGNATLSALQDALQPAVLRLVGQVVAGADAAGIPVAVCGELAGDPAGALVLVGLGVDELSMDAAALDDVRLVLSRATAAELADLARAALAQSDAAAVRRLVQPLVERAIPAE